MDSDIATVFFSLLLKILCEVCLIPQVNLTAISPLLFSCPLQSVGISLVVLGPLPCTDLPHCTLVTVSSGSLKILGNGSRTPRRRTYGALHAASDFTSLQPNQKSSKYLFSQRTSLSNESHPSESYAGLGNKQQGTNGATTCSCMSPYMHHHAC